MKLVIGALAAAFLVTAPLTGAAADAVSKGEIAEALSSQGYAVQNYDPSKIVVSVGEYSIVVAVDGADGDITYITWIPDLSIGDIGHEFLSKFNSEVKFGRAYVDSDGDITIQMDRNSAGGVSIQNIESDFDVFLLLISKFLSDIEARATA